MVNSKEVERIVTTALFKVIAERVTAPFMGTANPVSGVMKAIGGYLIVTNSKGLMKSFGYGLAIDGVEDIALSIMKGGLGGLIPSFNSEGEIVV